ncbi:MAG: amidohydrolase family protein, partial [Planctomycetota bacterium]
VDAHLHLPQFGIIGAHGRPLLNWLNEVTFPAEEAWSDKNRAAAQTSLALDRLVASGTTAFAAFATVHHDAAKTALQLADERGFRATIGQVLMDQYAPRSLCRPAEQLLDEANQLGNLFPPTGRVAAAVSPRFALSCSAQLLSGAGRLASEQGAVMQTHLAETQAECDQVREVFEKSYVDVYRDAGVLTSRTLFGHGIYLDSADRAQLAKAHSKIVHCPTANDFLNSGAMDWQALRESAIALAIGSDIGAGYETSMVRVAREMILTASRLTGASPSAAEAWYAITTGNAKALGWSDAGQLTPGSTADLVVIRPEIDWLSPEVDPLKRMLFAWDDRWIDQVLLRGKTAFSRC